ncbi:hypothetical protein IP88_01170 [alpha proteobacterium AAP81b]|nr:hypothetical protein IP88_01170 [alpha proteobacterium AAP81b]
MAAAAALAGLAGCSSEPPPPPPAEAAEQTVAIAAVTAAGSAARLTVPGTVRMKRETQLGFNSSGRIAAILVREGDRVARGQLLARLDPTSLSAAGASARAEAIRAEADVGRLQKLFDQGWVTAPRVEQARANAAAARARVAQTGFDIGLATIRAPAAGVVLRRPAEPGQIVAPGQAVLTVGEVGAGYVLQLPLADADLARLARGQAAQVRLPALGPAPVTAPISEIGARGDDGTGTFRVELALPALPGLRSGLIGTATLQLAGAAATGTAVTVPATAIFQARADEGFVYAYDAASGRVKRRMVALGRVEDGGVLVTAGLRVGERVVVSGPDRLRDGLRVRLARG